MPVGVRGPEREAFFLEGIDRQPDAFVADEDPRARKDLLDFILRFPTERAMDKFGGRVL
jgi:hypothetical protein